uniref:hypothetical protein n=1 Tax=Anunuuluaehu liula TaxID=3049639 RepID=UPI0030024A13
MKNIANRFISCSPFCCFYNVCIKLLIRCRYINISKILRLFLYVLFVLAMFYLSFYLTVITLMALPFSSRLFQLTSDNLPAGICYFIICYIHQVYHQHVSKVL